MYLMTDSEEDWTIITKEINHVNELKPLIFEVAEDEGASEQTLEAVEFRYSRF